MTTVPSNDPLLEYLRQLSGSEVYFFPNVGNAGDAYIAHATYALLDKLNISVVALPQTETVRAATVLVGGGGNLLEGTYGEVKSLLDRHLDHNRVIVLPHTIYGHHELMGRANDDFQIFCREPVTYHLAMSSGANARFVHLSHDISFFQPDDFLADLRAGNGSGMAQVFRTDIESTGLVPVSSSNRDISFSWNGDLWHNRELARHVTLSLAAYLAPFERVQTDRLHVSILAAQLGKAVALFPNSYFKNRAIFEHSMRDRFRDVTFVNTGSDLPFSDYLVKKIEQLEAQIAEAR